ncbi:MAG TPA: TatD family hydrolase [Gemmatimonadales bacterium]|nr:TatD family hydrolase [Gemmatimonadales bacterium]
MLIDTHCHLGDAAFEADRPAVVARAAEVGVTHVVIVADSVAATARAIDLARTHGLSATAGVHPHEAKTWSAETAAAVADHAAQPEVIAIGETGLDYHYDFSPRDAQRRAFAAQLQLAADRTLPVVIHAREADDDVTAMLAEHAAAVPALILHSFSSGPALFEAGLSVGAYFGFSGMVTFKNWPHGDYVTTCPADRLLVETDAPYLAPVPHRGRRNEPAFVRDVAERVAQLRDTDLPSVAELTSHNAARCFGPRVAQLPLTT